MVKHLLLALLFIPLIAGCATSHRLTDFTVLSTKNIDASSADRQDARASGEDCIWHVLFSFGRPNMKEAIDRAIEPAVPRADALIDGVLYIETTIYWPLPIIAKQCYRVEGTPILTSGQRKRRYKKKGTAKRRKKK